MSRIKKLETHYQKQLNKKDIKDVSVFIQSIVNADITKGKYARFLIKSFLNDQFLEEDLIGGLDSTVGQAISLFDKHKGKLPLEQRSVYALDKETKLPLYQSPGDLWNSVKQYQGELSGKELKKEEQEKIYRETEFIYKDEETGFQIISPLTEESAKWWGRGTRWCTSADKNNMFKIYAEDAPLLILLMPNGDKLQVWKYNNRIQFMDEADKTVLLEYIEKHWNVLEPIVKWIGKIQFFPKEGMTQEICMNTIHNNGSDLQYIPKDMITEEICKIAIQQDGLALHHVPVEMKTEEMYKLAVQKKGYILECVPNELRSEELYKLAVQQNGLALEYIPVALRTEELCKLAIKSNGRALYYVPDKFLTKEICKIAIQQNVHAIYDVPEKLKTPEIYEFAVKQNGIALQYVPEKLKTPKLYELAVEQNGMALQYIPKELITEKLCELAIKQNGCALQYIPKELITEKLCKNAIKQNGIAIAFIPDELKTIELCELAVQNNGFALKYVTEKLKTIGLYRLAVEQNGFALIYVPDELQKKMKQYIKPAIISQKRYQQVFSEIRSFFPNNTLSLDIN